MDYRIEKDSMGEMNVPKDAYYAAQTGRALTNFEISGTAMPPEFIAAVATVKMAAARANGSLGLLEKDLANAIENACAEIIDGKLPNEFPIDVYQTGSGTSTNMNVNEVVANRVAELMGGKKGDKDICHPNDHVNKGQSSNDVIPTAIHVSVAERAAKFLIPALEKLERSLAKKEKEFDRLIKIGRTHLMDAVPMTLGQEFSGWKQQVANGRQRVTEALRWIHQLPLGATALGTGINTHDDFPKKAVAEIASITGLPFVPTDNLFEGVASKDGVVYFMGALNTLAASFMKIGNDLRILSSGPRCGIGEIMLPSLQPGSSIMPGKVNPVIPEAVIQVAARVMGANATVGVAGSSGMLDLNVMMPLIADEVLTSIRLLGAAAEHLADKCVDGITANTERMEELVEWSMALVTPLALKIGYDNAAQIAYEAYNRKKTVREVTKEKGLLSDAELDDVFDPKTMI